MTSGKPGTAGSRTSVVLDKELRSKLFMLSQALNTDMGEIIRKAIKIFYEYTWMYAEETGNEKVIKLLELAEDKDVWETGVKADKIEEYARSKIKEGQVPSRRTGE